jgi:non-specific serine/threonine protein kinase/serine/threonine-protein kinase
VRPSDQDDVTSGHAVNGIDGERIGPYRLVREIGRGGMGTVYLAVRSDDAFQKRVALKVLKRGMDTDAIVRRFRNERQILASLDHPFISGLLDGGTTPGGLPYFAMEYVEGQPIDEYCDARQLDTTARLQMFMKICSAVQYAHQNLIIHRDIKPANVLVTADGTPKLLDFGIAKLLNPDLDGHTLAPTAEGSPLMTPEYASPEQVRGEVVTTATDVYSLGVLLYELLTGRRPYQLASRTPAEIARVVCNSVPERPSTAVTRTAGSATHAEAVTGAADNPDGSAGVERTRATDPQRLRRRLAGDLDNIVLKALNKEPARRYLSVDQFSEDIRRHLAGLPVIARKDTIGYRTAKFVRRNRTGVAAAVVILVALIAGIVGTSWQARAARRERARAEQRFEDVRHLANAALLDIHDAIRDLPGSTPARRLLVSKGLEYLDKLAHDAGDRPDLRRELAAAYVKVGDVQGRPLNPNLGDTAGALESYRKAVATYESSGAATSGDPALRRELAVASQRLSEILSATGDTKAALVQARRGLELLQQSTASAAGKTIAAAELGRELAASYTRVGDLLSATGDTSGALEHRRRALSVMETVAAIAPDDVATIRQLGVAYSKLGNQLGNPNYPNVGDLAGALVQLERAAAVFERALPKYPANAVFRRNLAIANSNIADVLTALKRPADALARQRQALASFEALSAADPANAAAKNDVAISLSKIAEMMDAGGNSAGAVREFERALAIHVAMAAADPANDSLKLELASDYNRLATSQAKLGTRDAALTNHTRAVTMSRDLQQQNPANVELRVALGLALAGRADAYVGFANAPASATRSADLAAAERDYRESVEIYTALQQAGSIEGSDLETLENNRKALDKVRSERAR